MKSYRYVGLDSSLDTQTAKYCKQLKDPILISRNTESSGYAFELDLIYDFTVS